FRYGSTRTDATRDREVKTLRQIKRVMIIVIGFTVLLVGIVLIVLPGPALIVIPAGLGILAVECEWARRWLCKTKEGISQGREVGKQYRAIESVRSWGQRLGLAFGRALKSFRPFKS